MPISLVEARRTKSRMEAREPFHWNGLTTRSRSMPSSAEVSTLPSQPTVIVP